MRVLREGLSLYRKRCAFRYLGRLDPPVGASAGLAPRGGRRARERRAVAGPPFDPRAHRAPPAGKRRRPPPARDRASEGGLDSDQRDHVGAKPLPAERQDDVGEGVGNPGVGNSNGLVDSILDIRCCPAPPLVRLPTLTPCDASLTSAVRRTKK